MRGGTPPPHPHPPPPGGVVVKTAEEKTQKKKSPLPLPLPRGSFVDHGALITSLLHSGHKFLLYTRRGGRGSSSVTSEAPSRFALSPPARLLWLFQILVAALVAFLLEK